jgi:hypothetical protein
MITHVQLLELAHYDPESGHFTWIKPRPKIRVGARAGYLHYRGYRAIEIYARAYAEHRLAWLYVYGTWPKDQIDHINRERSDNRISNLREATNGQNRANSKHMSRHGCKGIAFHGWLKENPWEARITVNKKSIYLGCFPTKYAAHQAYAEAGKKYFGEYHYTNLSEVPEAPSAS